MTDASGLPRVDVMDRADLGQGNLSGGQLRRVFGDAAFSSRPASGGDGALTVFGDPAERPPLEMDTPLTAGLPAPDEAARAR